MLDRSFTATGRTISTPPRTAAPLPMPPLAFQPPAHQGRGGGALAMLEQIEARDAALQGRTIIDWNLEPYPEPDLTDDDGPWVDLEPTDPSYSSAMPPEDEEDEEKKRQEGEDDEEENPPEEAALRVARQNDDEEDDEEKDIDITVIDVDDETEYGDDEAALRAKAVEPSILDLDDDIEAGETPPYDPQVPQGADPAVP